MRRLRGRAALKRSRVEARSRFGSYWVKDSITGHECRTLTARRDGPKFGIPGGGLLRPLTK